MTKARRASAQPGYRVEVELEDGLAGVLDLSRELYGPMFEPLVNVELFRQVQIDEFGVLSWPNGADLAPEYVEQELKRQNSASIDPAA